MELFKSFFKMKLPAVLTVLLLLSPPLRAFGQEVFKIGAIFPLSGAYGAWGLAQMRGNELMAEKINASGGVKVGGKQYQIKLIQADEKTDFNVALSQANKLIFNEGLKFILGPNLSGSTLAVQPVSEPQKVLLLPTSYSPKILGPDKKYSFRLYASGTERTAAVFLYLKKYRPDIKTIGSIGPNDETGWGTSTEIRKKAEEAGFKVVFKDFFERGTTDFYPLLTKLMQNPPDALVPHSVPPPVFNLLVKQKHELGFKGLIITPSFVELPILKAQVSPEAMEGIIFQTPDFTGPRALPGHRELYEAYLAKYKEQFSTTTTVTYCYLHILKLALEKAGTFDTTKVAETLETLEGDFPYGRFTMGGLKTYGLNHQVVEPIFMSEIKKAELAPLPPVTPTVP
ncbi:MAG: ABC transporter substrate-binding protein [Thermodesulfobacteriota bacterium]